LACYGLCLLISVWLDHHGYAPHQRDAMLRQAWTESRFQPCAVSGSSGSFGLYQWAGSRKRRLLAIGACPSWETQLKFADTELHTAPYSRFWSTSPRVAFGVLRECFGRGRC
jgi:hypothetical protein